MSEPQPITLAGAEALMSPGAVLGPEIVATMAPKRDEESIEAEPSSTTEVRP